MALTGPELRERRRLTAEARNVAIDRLKAAHRSEYDALYREEALARGINVRPTLTEQIAKMESELNKLRSEQRG